jgi:hypothetical protein
MKQFFFVISLVLITYPFALSQGTEWLVYTPQNSGLPDLDLSDIAIDGSDIKWILATNNLIKYDWISWEVFDSSNSIMPGGWWSGAITRGGDGNVWIGGFGGWGNYTFGLANVSSTPWSVFDTLNSSLAYISISSLSPSRDGGVWMVSWPGTLDGWGTLQKLTNNVWYSSQEQTYRYSEEIEEDLDGSVWYTVDNAFGAVHKISGDSTISYSFLSGAAQSIETDLYGNVWMSWYTHPFESSGLIKYYDDNWDLYTPDNSNLPTEHVWNLVADSLGNLWMSGEGLLKYDGNDFIHYTPQNSGLYSTNIRGIQIDEFNNKWIVHPNAISVFNEDGVTSVREEHQLPNAFKLQQNFPNPFNPSTSIQYAISSRHFVSLKVYDVLGNEVATLVNEEKPVGSYKVDFNGASLPSGIYFYQLRAGDPSTGSGQGFVETKKMVLMK